MRCLTLAAVFSLGLAASAAAQPRPYEPSTTAVPPPPPPPASDQAFSISTVAADLSGLNLRIEQDDARLAQLRAPELARQNAVLAGVKPAMPFRGDRWFPKQY